MSILRDNAIHYQSLGSTVRFTIATLWSVTYYLLSQTNEILNRFLSKEPSNLFRSSLVMFNFLTSWRFSEVLPVLNPSWKPTRNQTPKGFFHTNELTTPTIWTMRTLRFMKTFTTNYETAKLLKKSIKTTRSWSVKVWRQIGTGQKESLWKTTYWSRELSLFA